MALARDHEARHVAIWEEHLPALLEQTGPATVDADCALARSLADYWLQAVSVVHEQFHLEEQLNGRTWPPPFTGP